MKLYRLFLIDFFFLFECEMFKIILDLSFALG